MCGSHWSLKMMEEVEIVSIKAIKPSSPHSRIFKLTLLDQRTPPVYGGSVFFYPRKPGLDFSRISASLQSSLSETLALLYPLAGSLKDDSSIECNDEGACFVEARISCSLSDFLSKPDHKLLNALTPVTDSKKAKFANSLLLVQLTVFSCGGTALAVFPSHKIADATSLCALMQTWTAICLDTKVLLPKFIEGSALVHREFPNWDIEMPSLRQSTRRFVFSASKIVSLKTLSRHDQPSKVEVVLALILRRAIAASKVEGRSVLFHFINFRSKLLPPLPENTIGNIIWSVPVVFEVEDQMELSKMVGNIKRRLSDFYNEEVHKFQGEHLYEAMCDSINAKRQLMKSSASSYVCSSLCKLPFYETDFGWGSPVWVTSTNNARNKIVLLDTNCGHGVEAWVTLEEQEMRVFECDAEIRAFASLNPSVFSNDPCRL